MKNVLKPSEYVVIIVWTICISVVLAFGINETVKEKSISTTTTESHFIETTTKANATTAKDENKNEETTTSTTMPSTTKKIKMTETQKSSSQQSEVRSIVDKVLSNYEGIDPSIIMAIISTESSFRPDVSNGGCYGLMQVSKSSHSDRMKKLGVTDLYDPESNIKVGIDIFNDCLKLAKGDVTYALIIYNQGYGSASKVYYPGYTTAHSRKVLAKAACF